MALRQAEIQSGQGAALAQGYRGAQTRHLRPDGAGVTGYVSGPVVTDLGETAVFMCAAIGAQRLPLRARRTIEGICRMNDAEFERTAVIIRLERGGAAEERDALDRLGRICARISRLKIS
jgi:hypothetical protein